MHQKLKQLVDNIINRTIFNRKTKTKHRHNVASANAWPLIIDGPFADSFNCTICLAITSLTSFWLGDNIIHARAGIEEEKER